MAAAALTTWTHLVSSVVFLFSEALSLAQSEALSLDVISHATSLLLWVTSFLLRVVLYPLQAAAVPADGRGVVCPWVGCRVAGACSTPAACALRACAVIPSIPRSPHSDPPSSASVPRPAVDPVGSFLLSFPFSSVADAVHFGVGLCLCPAPPGRIPLCEVSALGWVVEALGWAVGRPPLCHARCRWSGLGPSVPAWGRSLWLGPTVKPMLFSSYRPGSSIPELTGCSHLSAFPRELGQCCGCRGSLSCILQTV